MTPAQHARLRDLVGRLETFDRDLTLPGFGALVVGNATLEDVALDWLEVLITALDKAHDLINDDCGYCDDKAAECEGLERELNDLHKAMRAAESKLEDAMKNLRSCG